MIFASTFEGVPSMFNKDLFIFTHNQNQLNLHLLYECIAPFFFIRVEHIFRLYKLKPYSTFIECPWSNRTNSLSITRYV